MTADLSPAPDITEAPTIRSPHYPDAGRYLVRVWRRHPLGPDGKDGTVPWPALVIVTELPDNPGPSVTNAAEAVYAWVQARWKGAVVVEHYRIGHLNQDRAAIVDLRCDGYASWTPAGSWLTALAAAS